MGHFTNSWNARLKNQHSGYERLLLQTFMTAPEWRNVEMAEEFGAFLRNGHPFYRYPYFKQIATFWKVLAKSYQAAKKHQSHKTILTSEYMLMSLFIGSFTTLSFMGLGLFSLLLSPVMKNRNASHFQNKVGKLVQNYGQFIHRVPFYNYAYGSKIKPIYQAFARSPHKTVADFITFITVLCQLLTRMLIAKPIAWWYNQPQNQEDNKIHLIVKSKLTQAQLKKIDPAIKVKQSLTKRNDRQRRAHYTHITLPRYEAFTDMVKKLVKRNVQIKKIASQDRIQFKILTDQRSLPSQQRAQMLYSYQNQLDSKQTVLLAVKTKRISETVKSLDKEKIKIKYMHDF